MAKSCKGCIYWRFAAHTSSRGLKICHYLLDTGEKRGCPSENCAHYTKAKRRKQKAEAVTMAEEKVLLSFKGHSIGYTYDEATDTYEWFTDMPMGAGKPPFRAVFDGEWAAQAARVRFMDNIESLFNRFFKKKFAELGIDPATGHREVNNVQQVLQPPHDS